MSQLRKFLFDVLQTVALSLGIFAIVYLFLLQPHQVKGHSMDPNFTDGEFLLTDKISYRFQSPKRGDVIVFAAPPARQEDFIKRIIGLPGEGISIKDGKLFVSGGELKEAYLPKSSLTFGGQFLLEGKEFRLKENEYFVLGDNRNHSSDSRIWGTINKEDIVGRAWLIYWPPPKVSLIPRPAYSSSD